MFRVIRAIVKLIVRIFFPTKVVGRENFIDKPSVIAGNHLSGWDVPIAYVSTPHRMMALAKKELIEIPVLGGLLRCLGAVPVDRKNVSPSTIKEVVRRLKGGEKLLLYPEGTRNRRQDEVSMSTLKNWAAFFALTTGVPVIPILLDKRPKVFRKNIFMVGRPIYFEGLKPTKEDIAKASNIIKGAMEQLRQDIEEYKGGGK